METLLGSSFGVFFAMTIVVAGFCAYMTGQAIARTWRPMWQLFPYAALLGVSDRFLVFALFDGPLLSLIAFVSNTAVLTAIALISYQLTRVEVMLTQYPWLYERDGLFNWKDRAPDSEIV